MAPVNVGPGREVRPVSAAGLYFIDAYSQVDQQSSDLSLITQRMKQNNVRKTLLAARGPRQRRALVETELALLVEETLYGPPSRKG